MADELDLRPGAASSGGPTGRSEGDAAARAEDLFARVVLALGLVDPAELEQARREIPAPVGSPGAVSALRGLLVKRGRLAPELASAIERVVTLAPAASESERPLPGVLEKPVPTGEGFALRSKKDVELAWATRRKGEPSASPERAPGAAAAEPGALAPPAAGGEPAATMPLESGKIPRPAESQPETSGGVQAPSPGSAPGADATFAERPAPSGASPADLAADHRRRKSFAAFRRRTETAAAEEEVDIQAIRTELGLDAKAARERALAAPDADPRSREVALRAFVRRIAPGMLYAHCLGLVARHRRAVATASRLAQEAGCTEPQATRVLELWRRSGIVRPDPTGVPEYVFAPSEADLAEIREFLRLWGDETWHRRLLEWLVEEEGR